MKHFLGVTMVRFPSRKRLDLDFSLQAQACIHQLLLHNTRTLKCTHTKQKSNSNNLKTGIIIISLQIHLGCPLAASLTFCQETTCPGCISKTFQYFRSLFYNRLKHASNCPQAGGKCSQEPPARGVHCSSQRSEFKD